MTTHAVTLLSGGLDSTTLMYDLAQRYDTVQAVSIHYGQRHRRELLAADEVQRPLQNVTWDTVHIVGLSRLLTGSVLTAREKDIPEGHYADENMAQTVVPNRNAMMLSIAYAVGITQNAQAVTYAAHGGDHPIYPDCRPAFVSALAASLHIGNYTGQPLPTLAGSYVGYIKADLVRIGARLNVPFHKTWSCYKGGTKHCGRCGTCIERAEAFHIAGITDPTEYEDPYYWQQVVAAKRGD